MSVGLLVWGPYQGAAKAKFPHEITNNRGDWHLLNQLTSSEIGCLATRSLGEKKEGIYWKPAPTIRAGFRETGFQ